MRRDDPGGMGSMGHTISRVSSSCVERTKGAPEGVQDTEQFDGNFEAATKLLRRTRSFSSRSSRSPPLAPASLDPVARRPCRG
jgi:hypothetical protein